MEAEAEKLKGRISYHIAVMTDNLLLTKTINQIWVKCTQSISYNQFDKLIISWVKLKFQLAKSGHE